MKRLVIAALLAAPAAAAEPAAWFRVRDTYDQMGGTNYAWLAHQYLDATLDVPPAPGLAVDLLWGSKNDERALRLSVNGVTGLVARAGGYRGFRAVRVPLPPDLQGDRLRIRLDRLDEGKVAFIAGLRLVPADSPPDAPWPDGDAARAHYRLGVDPRPPVDADWHPDRRAFWDAPLRVPDDGTPESAAFRSAEVHGRLAAEAFFRCRLFTRGWLAHADPASGLLPENLRQGRDRWNGRNAAADNYPFLVLSAALTDRPLFEGRLLDLLRAEQRLTARQGRLGDVYRFSTRGFEHDEPDWERMVFDNAEYVKDGLLPITEWLGPSPWSERMVGLAEDIWAGARTPSGDGFIPSAVDEVNGDMMQAGARIFGLTGDRQHLEGAIRIADHYLLGPRQPLRDFRRIGLNDHGGEIINGLSEVYAMAPECRDRWRRPLLALYDHLLEHARNPHGMFYAWIEPASGRHAREIIDTWGYLYDGFLTLALVEGIDRYREAVRFALSNLKPHYTGHMWQGGSADGFADSLEGALNLVNRLPDAGAEAWIDTEIRRMWLIQLPDGVVEGWHGDGNFARTSLMYALWKTQGITAQPWREDLAFGAARDGDTLRVTVTAERPWSGRLAFDRPRHREQLHLPLDYPRINQFPEWFTVAEDEPCQLDRGQGWEPVTASRLREGLPVEVSGGGAVRLRVRKGR